MSQQLAIDPKAFLNSFPEKPFVVEHHLVGHPLFELSRLIELSRYLPEKHVEYNAGNVPITQDPKSTPRNGLSVEDTIRRIEDCQSWLVLKYVEQEPLYKALLDECLDQVRDLSGKKLSGMYQREGFIFISSAGSVTPYHMDPEHNFLLQIRGDKTVHMFDANDRSLLSEEELEQFNGGGHRNLVFKDEYQQKAQSFVLKPGQGVHFPLYAPHWVKNGSSVSVSFSITFRSPESERASRLYYVNSRLRSLGLKPTPVGKSPLIDLTKYSTYRVCRKTKYLFGFEGQEERAEY